MNQNKLFHLTRVRLALWYAIAIALILSLCGLGDSEQLYRLVSNLQQFSIELTTLSGRGFPAPTVILWSIQLKEALTINAIQYTPKGGKVTVVLNRIEYYAVIQVQDTGIGIPQQELPQIFDRFYRVNSDRSRSNGGSGLGLAIVQAHQGNIQVQSQLGFGSTFIVRLPLEVTRSSLI